MINARILIIDSNKKEAKETQRILKKMGYAICEMVSDSSKALVRTRSFKPDLVLMDTVLKNKMDGIEIADQIQRQLNIPVIFLTSHTEKRVIKRVKAAFPFGYLIKPLDEHELDVAIEMAIYRNQTEQKLERNTYDLNDRIKELNCLHR